MARLSAALDFLDSTGSPFFMATAQWLRDLNDPSEVLIALSREVGDAIGPWETFRYCALLGLGESPAVRELGLDVLDEELDPSDPTPPLAQALAIAHAKLAYPQEDAPHAEAVLLALGQRQGDDGEIPPFLIGAAMVALSGPGGAARDDALFAQAQATCIAALEGEAAPVACPTILEACLLGGVGPKEKLSRLARETLGRAQQADGGFVALADNKLVRGFVTARAVALLRRGG
jgi:hypothetical protein